MTNFEKLIEALANPATDLEAALQQLLTQRGIATAQGAQLDVVGRIVGQLRNGLNDDDYRRYLYARVATNRSTGKRADHIKISRLVVNNDAMQVQVLNQGIAGVVVRLAKYAAVLGVPQILISFLRQAVAAGVRIILEFEADLESEMMTTAVSAFLSAPISGGATTLPVGDTSSFPDTGSLDIEFGVPGLAETVTYGGKTATSFIGVSATAHAHASGAPLSWVGSPGKGLGGTSDPAIGGKLAGAVE